MRFKINHKKYIIQIAAKEVNKDDSYKDDYVSKSMGAFGRWQCMYVVNGAIIRMLPFWNCLSVIFLAPEAKFACKTFSDNVTIDATNNTCYENCIEYAFEENIFESTLITEFHLICEDTWKASFIQTVLMFGVLSGVSFYGWFSDRFGRSRALMTSGINCIVFMFSSAFSRSYWTVIVLRYLIGVGTGGIYALVPVFTSEIVGAEFVQIVLGISIPLADAVALVILAGCAFLMSSWRTFTLVYGGISVLIVGLIFLLPETPRWLIAKNKAADAIVLMTRAAKFNGMNTTNIVENVTKATEHIKLKQENEINLTYLDLARTKKLAMTTVGSLMIWVTTGFSYYGLLQYISQFGSNVYVIVCIFSVLHLVSILITFIILKYFGRKTACIFSFSTVGVVSTILIFTPKESAPAVVLGSVGVTFATLLFTVIYIYVIELYSTPMRNMGLSFSSAGSKAAAMVAPFVINMMSSGASSAVFAAVSFIAALFCLLLPETKGKGLKDTLDDE